LPHKEDIAGKPPRTAGSNERRPKSRKRVLLTGIIASAGGDHSFGCTIRDLSETGARIVLPKGARLPLDFYLINIRDRTAYESRLVRSHGVEAGITFKRTLPLSNLTHPALGFPKALVAVPGHALTPRPGADQLTRNFLPAPRTRPGPPPIPADSRKYGNEMAMAVPCLIRR
jgi:hypothetical protein